MKRSIGLVLGLLWLCSNLFASSLWQAREEMHKGSFFIDRRAHRVGDILTIVVSEISTAETSADTKTKRESTIQDEVKSWVKVVLNKMGILPDIKAFSRQVDNLPNMDVSASHEYKSKGKTTRSQRLTAKIAVKIVEILPNGNYVVEGQKQILVNGERQEVTFTGEVSPEDIRDDNTVESYKVANARIFYKGNGTVGDKQNGKGLLELLFDLAWLF